MSTQQELQGINLLTKAQYDAATRSENQLYAVQGQFVIETYENGTSWYRVYSDLFIEQGSIFEYSNSISLRTFNLLRQMNTTNYLILRSTIVNNTNPPNYSYVGAIWANDKTINFFKSYIDVVNNGFLGCYWIVSGF